MRAPWTQGLAALLAVLLAGCQAPPRFPEWLLDARTPRERYEARLEQAGLTGTALGRDWLEAAGAALGGAPLVVSPHVEEGYLSPAEPAAIGYRVEARRGQEIHFEITFPGDTVTELFLDLWEVGADSIAQRRLVATADSGVRSLTYAPRRPGTFVVRVQPELLRGGRFRTTLRVVPLFAFPVRGRTEHDIGSRFGAPREGGRRSHHGIDIFAPRGTLVVAPAAGAVRRVEQTDIGGNVVWVRDDRGHVLYFAHLAQATVVEGARVAPGDTVGFVGNTGNARTTPPHLHFGIYRRGEGPIDPYWFVRPLRGRLARLVADTVLLGEWARTQTTASMRAAPADRAAVVRETPRHTILRVVAAVGAWYRVRLPDGTSGYVVARQVEPTSTSVETAGSATRSAVLARPSAGRPIDVVAELAPGDSVDVLGRFGPYRLVRTSTGRAGWMAP